MRQRTTNPLEKLIRPAPSYRTRLHDGKGNFVGWSRLLRHGPYALLTGIRRLLWNDWPDIPWLSYAAIRVFAQHLTSASRVLEFGSGHSTIWFARRCGQIYSIEDSLVWFQRVQSDLHRHSLTNVTYDFCPARDEYVRAPERYGGKFDLIIVDGSHRQLCVQSSLPYLTPGGILYIDNTDEDLGIFETMLRAASQHEGGRVQRYTDLVPTQLYVSQGLMYFRDGTP